MVCYWNGKQSSNYADRLNNERYIIFPDDINAENGELGFCETIFQAIERALNILDAIDLTFLAVNIAKKIKEFIKLLRVLLQEYRKNPNKYRKVLKDLIIQLKQLIRELQIEIRKIQNNFPIKRIIRILEDISRRLEQLTGIGCTLLNRAFIHPIDNQQYSTLCAVGRDGIESWLVNNITSPFGLIKWKPTDLNYDRIILSRKNILTRIFDEVCTCIEFGDPPPFTPTPTPTNTCIPCRSTQIAVYDLECREIIESTIAPVIYKLNQNGEEIPVSIIDMVDCTENPDVLDLLTCTLTTCTPTTSIPTTSTNTNTDTDNPINLDCIIPGTIHCYQQWYQRLVSYNFRPAEYEGSTPAPVGTPYTEWFSGSRWYEPEYAEAIRSQDWERISKAQIMNNAYPRYQSEYIENTEWIANAPNVEYYVFTPSFQDSYLIYAPVYRTTNCSYNPYEPGRYAVRHTYSVNLTIWVVIDGEDSIYWWGEKKSTINLDLLGCISPVTTPTRTRKPTPTPTPIPIFTHRPTFTFTPTFNPTPTPTPTPTHTPTFTPSSSNDLECNFQYFWYEDIRELCISNGSDAPMLVIIQSESSPPIEFQINPNNTRCATLEVDVHVTIYSRDGTECWNKNL